MKSECPTFLRSKGKAMAITLSDDKVFDHKFIIMAKQMKTNPSQTMIQVRQISLL